MIINLAGLIQDDRADTDLRLQVGKRIKKL